MVLVIEVMCCVINGGYMLKVIEELMNGLGVYILDFVVEIFCGVVMGLRSGFGSVFGGGVLFFDLGGGSV